MNYAGLIYDDSRHYLDHLGPFCSLMGWPLIICEEAVSDLAKRYYPNLVIIEKSIWEVRLPPRVLTCDTKALLEASFPGQDFQTIWLPHGNSDKGWHSPFFEALQDEKMALVYGQKMIDFMHAKNAFPNTVRIGNFRWRYFLQHENYYRSMNLIPEGKNYLYAPTWDDSEQNNSFWNAFPSLAQSLPEECNLLVKLHPNTLRKFEVEIEIAIGRYGKKNIHFLPEIPTIYPLLSRCDSYIGDMSSIGYDFLKFNRPMYFLNAQKHLPLQRCGLSIDPKNFQYKNDRSFSAIQKMTYDATFDPDPDWGEIKRQIDALCGI